MTACRRGTMTACRSGSMRACRYPSDCKACRGQLVHHLRMPPLHRSGRTGAAATAIAAKRQAPGRGGGWLREGEGQHQPAAHRSPSRCRHTRARPRGSACARHCQGQHLHHDRACAHSVCSKTGLQYKTHALHCTVRHCSIRIHAFWHAQPRAQVTIAIAAVLFRPVDPHGLSRERHVPCIAAQRSGAHRMVSSPPHPRNRHNRTNQRCRGQTALRCTARCAHDYAPIYSGGGGGGRL
jgi:hypothetical protein